MNYVYTLEISAFLFLLVIAARFYEKRQFPNYQNKIFGVYISLGIIDLLLDFCSSLAIDLSKFAPITIIYLACSLFYNFRCIFSYVFIRYIDVLTGRNNHNNSFLKWMLIPIITYGFLTIINCSVPILFYVNNGIYYHGIFYFLVYLIPALYLLVGVFYLIIYRKEIVEVQFTSIAVSLILIIIAMIIQIVFPRILISGVATTLSITIVYFTLQNPESLLDVLTNTFNYRAMIMFIEDCISFKNKYQLIAIDIHGMRRINHIFGINNCDKLLIQISDYLQSYNHVWVFRPMGTRFIVFCKNENIYNNCLVDFKQRFNKPFMINNQKVLMNMTVCYCNKGHYFHSPEELMGILETVFVKTDLSSSTVYREIKESNLKEYQRQLEVEEVLRQAIEERKYIDVHIQPIYCCRTKEFNSGEALLRFKHPTMGNISPSEFVPIAEKNGLVRELDELVLIKVCEFIKEFKPSENYKLYRIAINLSAVEFMNDDIVDKLDEIINYYQIDKEQIIFEITETAASSSKQVLYKCMNDLIEKGYHFSLDDFGSGYANLTQVLSLPFDIIKLDRSVLLGTKIVFNDMIKMILHLNKQIVIEGVETKEQFNLFNGLDVGYVQGFYFARPQPLDELLVFLKENNLKDA